MVNNKNILWFQYVLAYEHRVKQRETGNYQKKSFKIHRNTNNNQKNHQKKKIIEKKK